VRQDVHELRLQPKEKSEIIQLPIEWVDIRIVGLTHDEALDLVEKKFPDFNVIHIVSGYRNV